MGRGSSLLGVAFRTQLRPLLALDAVLFAKPRDVFIRQHDVLGLRHELIAHMELIEARRSAAAAAARAGAGAAGASCLPGPRENPVGRYDGRLALQKPGAADRRGQFRVPAGDER